MGDLIVRVLILTLVFCLTTGLASAQSSAGDGADPVDNRLMSLLTDLMRRNLQDDASREKIRLERINAILGERKRLLAEIEAEYRGLKVEEGDKLRANALKLVKFGFSGVEKKRSEFVEFAKAEGISIDDREIFSAFNLIGSRNRSLSSFIFGMSEFADTYSTELPSMKGRIETVSVNDSGFQLSAPCRFALSSLGEALRSSDDNVVSIDEMGSFDCPAALQQFQERMATFEDTRKSILGSISALGNILTESENILLSNIAKQDAVIDEVESSYKSSQINAERDISLTMLGTIMGTIIVFALIMMSVMWAIIRLAASVNQNQALFSQYTYPVFLELVTVFVLTVTILILGLANKMDNEALAALIGGISGYVLGRMKQTSENRRVDEEVNAARAAVAGSAEGRTPATSGI